MNHRYLLATLEIEQALDMNLVSALNVDEQLAIQQSLNNTLIFGLFFIILIASGLGIWQSQRISQPIVNLANAAEKFRQGIWKPKYLCSHRFGRSAS
jgi:nitrogen fixation/metabolism regulation signal transduction histidine kinase